MQAVPEARIVCDVMHDAYQAVPEARIFCDGRHDAYQAVLHSVGGELINVR